MKKRSKAIKIFAVSQIFMMILEIFAVSFIFTMSLGEVSGVSDQVNTGFLKSTYINDKNRLVTYYLLFPPYERPATAQETAVYNTATEIEVPASPAASPVAAAAATPSVDEEIRMQRVAAAAWEAAVQQPLAVTPVPARAQVAPAGRPSISLSSGRVAYTLSDGSVYYRNTGETNFYREVNTGGTLRQVPANTATIAELSKMNAIPFTTNNEELYRTGVWLPLGNSVELTLGGTTYVGTRDLNSGSFGMGTDYQGTPLVSTINDKTYASVNGKRYEINTATRVATELTDNQIADLGVTTQAPGGANAPGGTLPVDEEKYNTIIGKMRSDQPFWGNMLEGVLWASAAWLVVEGLGKIGIIPEEMTKALGAAIWAGIMTGKLSQAGMDWWTNNNPDSWTKSYGGYVSTGVGLVIGYLVFANNYKKVQNRQYTIDFKCMSWQAPKILDKSSRSAECNKCNINPLQTCSEYRCKALGQSCKIINEGTALVKCIDGGVDDVNSPGIKPYKEVLTAGYVYEPVRERPAGNVQSGRVSGMGIKYNGGCLKPWTPFDFGITTFDMDDKDLPAQCKIDFNHTVKFDDMTYWMGDTNMFIENHSQRISLPGTDYLNGTFPELENDGDYKLYIRCRNGNGNANTDEFVVSFCVDKTPDLTPPVIKSTSPITGSPVLYRVDNLSVSVYTNEPSACKWSRKSVDYNSMENNLSCSNNVWELNAESLYTCIAALTGIRDKEENKFYFRCKDLSPQQNVMTESYEYTLIGTQPLTILSVGPSGTIGSPTSIATINLSVKTDNGFRNGEATCYYSTSSSEASYQQMFDTGGKNMHYQNLDLAGGTYTYYFKCVDLGGNAAYNSTSFIVYIDKAAPLILRLYKVESNIRMVTNEEALCKYSTTSCNFDINSEGVEPMPYQWTKEQWVPWKTDQVYYIKCMDKFNNQPDPAECSVIIRPYELSMQAE